MLMVIKSIQYTSFYERFFLCKDEGTKTHMLF